MNMNSTTLKNSFRKRIVMITIALFISFIPTAKSAFADCTQQDNGFVFLHPFFSGTYWKYASDSMDITVPQQLCDSKPYRYFASGTADSSVGLIIDSTGLVSVHTAKYAQKDCQCCRIQFLLDSPVATTLSVSRDVAAAFIHKDNTLDTLYFAYQRNTTSFDIVSIGRGGALIATSTITLNNPGTRVITAINSTTSGSLQGFWVSGTRGLVRYIPVTTNGIGTEVVYDIGTASATDTILYASSSSTFSTSGGVYEWSGNTLVKSTTLSIHGNFASHNILADNQNAFVKNGTVWNMVTDILGPLHGSNIIRSSSGVAVEYLSDNWVLNVSNVADSQSRIASVSPLSVFTYVNKGAYSYIPSKAETLTVIASDPDSNTQLPEITVENGTQRISIFSSSPYNLTGRSVDLVCEIGTAKMSSDTFKVIMRTDSIIFESNFLLGVTNIICNTPNWSKRKLRYGEKWYNNSGCVIRVGTDSLLLINNLIVSTLFKNNAIPKGISFLYKKSSIICTFLNKSHTGGSISFWGINGRLLHKMQFSKAATEVVATIPDVNQMVIFRVEFSDGTYFEQKHIPLR
jgi:hypothetical protein